MGRRRVAREAGERRESMMGQSKKKTKAKALLAKDERRRRQGIDITGKPWVPAPPGAGTPHGRITIGSGRGHCLVCLREHQRLGSGPLG